MKLTVGLGSIDEYVPYVEAGADELFCGYVPEAWSLKYGMGNPLNRREVCYYNVQIGSESELQIMQKMVKKYKVPVSITFNSLYYAPEQYSMIAGIMRQCMQYGYQSFIVADTALLVYLRECAQDLRKNGMKLHLSGETAEVNSPMLEEFRKLSIDRVIFHRKNTIADMQSMISYQTARYPDKHLSYEAFILNEMCHFTGAFCNSLHCDELVHMCKVPYIRRAITDAPESDEKQFEQACTYEEQDWSLTGATGCGLCALWRLRQAGITHLKLVSRGNYIDNTIRDIKALRTALEILEQSGTEVQFVDKMKNTLFPCGKCSGSCYYKNEIYPLYEE